MENYIDKEVSDALAKEMAEKIVSQIKTRVKKGEKYHFIDDCGFIGSEEDNRELQDDLRHKIGNYFPFGDEEAEAMARKLRAVLNGAWVLTPPEGETFSRKVEAVLKGADVIEMPSEEETLKMMPDGIFTGWEKCYEFLKSKIVK